MSRRPRTSTDPLIRAVQVYDRMAPGGTIASESPVVRPKGMAAGGVLDLVTGPTLLTYDVSMGTADPDSSTLDLGETLTAGQRIVGLGLSWGQPITPPTGWTTVVSGVVGSLHYTVAWRVATGTDDMAWTFAGDCPAWVPFWVFDSDGTAASLAASTPVETLSADTQAMAADAGAGWAGAWNVWAGAPADQTNTTISDFSADVTGGGGYSGPAAAEGIIYFGFGVVGPFSSPPWVLAVADGIVLETYPARLCEWVTLCLGWAP